MSVIREASGDLTAILKVQINESDYSTKIDKALGDYRKKASINGFRPGKAPMGLIKKTYGHYALVDTVNELVYEKLNDYIEKEKIEILGQPIPSEEEQAKINWETDTNFEFAFEIGLKPQINLDTTLVSSINYYKISAKEEMIDSHIEYLRNRFGTHSEGEIVKDNDIIRGVLVEVDSAGNEVPEGIVRESASIYINSIKDEEIKARFISLKLNDTIIYNPIKATENEADVASLLGTEKENSVKINADYKFTIESISHFEQAEINQEFFDKAFGEGIISSEAEMRDKVKAEIEGRFESNSEIKFMNDCREKLIEASAIELPETFLKKWLKITNKDNDKLTDDVFETEFPLFIKDLRWQVIKGKLVTDLEIKLTQEDILGAAKEQARQQFYQFGMFSPDEEMVNRWADEIVKNKEELNKIIEIESDRKISRSLKEKTAINTKEVTVEEFSSLIEK